MVCSRVPTTLSTALQYNQLYIICIPQSKAEVFALLWISILCNVLYYILWHIQSLSTSLSFRSKQGCEFHIIITCIWPVNDRGNDWAVSFSIVLLRTSRRLIDCHIGGEWVVATSIPRRLWRVTFPTFPVQTINQFLNFHTCCNLIFVYPVIRFYTANKAALCWAT